MNDDNRDKRRALSGADDKIDASLTARRPAQSKGDDAHVAYRDAARQDAAWSDTSADSGSATAQRVGTVQPGFVLEGYPILSEQTVIEALFDDWAVLTRQARRWGRSKSEAEDLLQELFVLILQKLQAGFLRFEHPEAVKHYARSVLRRKGLELRRVRARTVTDNSNATVEVVPDRGATPDEVVVRRGLRSAFVKALMRLDDEDRAFLAAIAARMPGSPPLTPAIRKRLQRTREKLRVILAEMGIEPPYFDE